MKKKNKCLIALAPAFIVSTLIGCNANPEVATYTVKFNCSAINEKIAEQKVKHGEKVSKPTTSPTAKDSDAKFDSYYLAGRSTKYDFSTPVTSDITIDARVKDYTHTVTFDPDKETLEGTRKVQVIHGQTLTGKDLNIHTPKDENMKFYAWLDSDEEMFDISKPIERDITLRPGLTSYWIDLVPDNDECLNLNIDNSNSVKFTPMIEGTVVEGAETSVVPGYDDLITQVGTHIFRAPIGSIPGEAYIVAKTEYEGNEYFGLTKVCVGSYNKLDSSKLAQCTAYATSESSGDVAVPPQFYDYNGYKNWRTITSIADSGFKESKVTSVVLPETITKINDNAFKNSALNNISLNEGLLSIGKNAFDGCINLPLVSIVSIPKSVSSIDEFAFIYSGIQAVDFAKPDSWTYDGSKSVISKDLLENTSTAADCLTNLYVDKKIERVDNDNPTLNLKKVELEINDTYVTHCDLNANQDVWYKSEDESVATVEDGCVVAKGAGSTYIDAYNVNGKIGSCEVVVRKSEKLEDVALAEKVPHGGIEVKFGEQEGLKYLTLPKSIKYEENGETKEAEIMSIVSNGFAGCNNLESVYIPKNITYIGSYGFYGCENLQTVIFAPDTRFTTISDYGFANCSKLSSIDIPDTVTDIGNYAFKNCTSLKKVRLPNNKAFMSVCNELFSQCASLETVVIPNTITTIGDRAFKDCTSLNNVYCTGTVEYFEELSSRAGSGWHENAPFTVVHCSNGDFTFK